MADLDCPKKWVWEDAIIRCAENGEYGREIQVLHGHDMAITRAFLNEENVVETEHILPPPVQDYIRQTPIVRIYIDEKRAEKRAEIFSWNRLEIWNGPISSVAEIRKHILAYAYDEKSELGECDERKALMLSLCIQHLVDLPEAEFCGCGTPLVIDEDKEGTTAVCESCGAYLCDACGAQQNCGGCFNLLLEAANDIGDVEEEDWDDESEF